MSDKHMHNQIETFAAIHAELPLHERSLRAQLLARYTSKHASQPRSVSAFINPLKEYFSIMKTHAKVASFAGMVMIAVVAAVTIVSLSHPSSASAAEVQLKEAKTVVQELSPQQAAALKQRVDTNLAQHLDEGLQAKDSRIISSQEFQKATGIDPAVKLPGMKISSYVAFTNADGDKVIIAVESNDQPVLLMIDSGKGWTSPSQVQMQ